ncbi:Uncharacterised protein [Jonesia denitrificans]|nr:Uncharacterised protein [Jonesia denitrificans]
MIVGMSVSLLRGRTVRRVLSVLVVAGLLGAGVTGCSNDAGAKTENTVDASPTPTNTPTDGDGDSAEEPAQDTPAEPEQRPVPEEPEAMKTGDKAGAIAAATFFVEVIEYSLHSNNPELLEKYSYENCTNCNNLIETIAYRSKNGYESLETSYVINSVGTPSYVGTNHIIWGVPMSITSKEQLNRKESEQIETNKLTIYVTYENGEWDLTSIDPDGGQSTK